MLEKNLQEIRAALREWLRLSEPGSADPDTVKRLRGLEDKTSLSPELREAGLANIRNRLNASESRTPRQSRPAALMDLSARFRYRVSYVGRLILMSMLTLLAMRHDNLVLQIIGITAVSWSVLWAILVEARFPMVLAIIRHPWDRPVRDSFDLIAITAFVYATGTVFSFLVLAYGVYAAVSSAARTRFVGLYATVFSVVSYLVLQLLVLFDVFPLVNFLSNGAITPITPFAVFLSTLLVVCGCAVIHMSVFESYRKAERERAESDRLLLNVVPARVAAELRSRGSVDASFVDAASVLYADIVGFAESANRLSPQMLLDQLNRCFTFFDSLSSRFRLEKIKSMGDAYMACAGVPEHRAGHAVDCVLAALEMKAYMAELGRLAEQSGRPVWSIRIGIHSGPMIAGITGQSKFAYDVFGETVTMAGRINAGGASQSPTISSPTFELVKEYFECVPFTAVENTEGETMDTFVVRGIKPEFCRGDLRHIPNDDFRARYRDEFGHACPRLSGPLRIVQEGKSA